MASVALEAISMLSENDVEAGIVLCEFIKPYDALADLIAQVLPEGVKNIVFLEEEIMAGGFGMNLSAEFTRRGINPKANHTIIAVDDNFAIPSEGENVWQAAKVDSHSVYQKILELQ